MADAPAPQYAVDIADDTFLVAAPGDVATVVADPASWRAWWPDLELRVTRDRGVKGLQWAVGGPLTGSMEIWLEPWGDGVVLHWYLRAEPDGPRTRRSERLRERRVRSWKADVHALKDHLEQGREPGSRRSADRVKNRAKPADSP